MLVKPSVTVYNSSVLRVIVVRAPIPRSQMSDDRSLTSIETLGRRVGLEPEELTYVRNPFEIFHKSSSHLK